MRNEANVAARNSEVLLAASPLTPIGANLAPTKSPELPVNRPFLSEHDRVQTGRTGRNDVMLAPMGASPLALWGCALESGGGPPQSKTLARCVQRDGGNAAPTTCAGSGFGWQ